MRAEPRRRGVAAALCLLSFAAAPAFAQAPAASAAAPPPLRAERIAEFDARWGSPDRMLFLPAIYAELARRN